MGKLAPVVSAVLRDQGAVVAGSDDGAAAQDPRSCGGVFKLKEFAS